MNTIRQLRPGEPIPSGMPGRYKSGTGYIRLRWKVGKRQYVEAYEHRVLAGAAAAQHVHHANRNRSDNTSANLHVLTPEEHAKIHGGLPWLEEAERLYGAGLSTVEIGERVGRNPATVYRAFRRHGISTRTTGGGRVARFRRDIDVARVVELHRAGYGRHAIHRAIGRGSPDIIAAILKDAGEKAHRPGRQPGMPRVLPPPV